VGKMLDIWPAFPIVIGERYNEFSQVKGAENIVAALGHPNRVCRINLRYIPNTVLGRFAAAMKEPFPELTDLDLHTMKRSMALVLPDSFLGGSAPCLERLRLCGISFPGIPKVLSSASDLLYLHLQDIPHSGYISPEAMVSGLSALTRLKHLSITFQSPRSHPDRPSPPRSIRTVLPALTYFWFRGVSEYLEDLTSRIDAPLLNDLRVTFFNQLIFNIPRLCSFISHAKKLRSQSQARMTFYRDFVGLSYTTAGRLGFDLRILCKASDWQLSSLTQVCDPPFLSLFNSGRLQIDEDSYLRPHWQDDVEHTQWLEVLHPFITMKSLSISKEFTPRVVPALQELSGDGMTDGLPALQSIFLPESSLSGPVKEALAQFVTARRLSGHPVTVNPPGQE
jgi:hypothetical protein